MSTTRDPISPPSTSGYAELLGRVRHEGLLRRRPGYYAALALILLTTLGGVVTALVLLRHSWWVLLLAPVYAVVSTQFGFFGHDVAHRQVTQGGRGCSFLGLVSGNLLNGLSYGWWVAKHNAHHAHPNDLETDPDVAVGAFVFDADQAGHRTGIGAWLTRHQAWLFFPMLMLEAFNLHISSVRAVVSGDLRHRFAERSLLATHFVLYAALVASTMTWAQAAVFIAIHQGLFGLYLGCSFAPSHKGMPILTSVQATDPLLRQVLASRNIRSGRVLDVVLGGLNLQIEHHLFPSMPRPNLRRAQPVVQAFCVAHGVSYAETSALGAYGAALRHLHQVGTALRQ
jgi:fatty acid desaturase